MSTPRISDTWERGSPYERYIGRWSRLVAPAFLTWLGRPHDERWLDVGCGTGALCAAILDRCAPASLTGVEPSEGFLGLAAQNLGDRVRLRAGSAAALPLDDASCDVVVSGLVLNFVPDTAAGLAEMRRVTAPGGTVAAYVWDYGGEMEIIRIFWDCAVALDPACAGLHEGPRFPLCTPAALRAAFEAAGFANVATTALDARAEFRDFDDYWQPFLGGQGPAPAYVASLSDDRRAALREALRARIAAPRAGPVTLRARAWAVSGRAPVHAGADAG